MAGDMKVYFSVFSHFWTKVLHMYAPTHSSLHLHTTPNPDPLPIQFGAVLLDEFSGGRRKRVEREAESLKGKFNHTHTHPDISSGASKARTNPRHEWWLKNLGFIVFAKQY